MSENKKIKRVEDCNYFCLLYTLLAENESVLKKSRALLFVAKLSSYKDVVCGLRKPISQTVKSPV